MCIMNRKDKNQKKIAFFPDLCFNVFLSQKRNFLSLIKKIFMD